MQAFDVKSRLEPLSNKINIEPFLCHNCWVNRLNIGSGFEMEFERIDSAISKANESLHRCKVERRDRKLALRGSFPRKPGEGHGNKRRYIALGVYANPDGVKVAKAKAQKLESDLNLDRFKWSDWEKGGSIGHGKTAADWGKELAKVKRGTIKPASFEANYREPLTALPDKPLSEELLRSQILSRHPADSWGRKNDCMVYKQLCKLAGIPIDFSTIKGSYKPKPVRVADLPTDKQIVENWASIKNPGWQWIYGMMATYGLRPHEVFRIKDHKAIASDNGMISVLDDSKTS